MTRCDLSWPQNTKQIEVLYQYIKAYFKGDYSMLGFFLLYKTLFSKYYVFYCYYFLTLGSDESQADVID